MSLVFGTYPQPPIPIDVANKPFSLSTLLSDYLISIEDWSNYSIYVSLIITIPITISFFLFSIISICWCGSKVYVLFYILKYQALTLLVFKTHFILIK